MEKNYSLPEGTKVPDHIAIIPDGNRRWARARGLKTLEGHKAGYKRGVELGRVARSWGITTLTFWGFSTENWDRSPMEVRYLMKLIGQTFDDYLADAHKDHIKITHIGRKDRIPRFLLKKIQKAEQETAHYTKFYVNLAIDYGGHDELIRATKKMISDGAREKDITKAYIESYLDTQGQPYPYVDLLVRSSGEQRTSGLLLWQMEYAEMYWEHNHFPDFTPEKLREAILDYSRRRRRFGGNDAENHLAFKPELAARFEVNWWRLANIPEGTKFRDYAANHLVEQWGISKQLAGEATVYFAQSLLEGNKKKWRLATKNMAEFYKLLRDEVKLAFEPSFVASLEVKLLQRIKTAHNENSQEEVEQTTRRLISEVYRLSDFQVTKAAHLRTMATIERALAENGRGEIHWENAERYLEAYYQALKDRVA